jgi:hypothetical protein
MGVSVVSFGVCVAVRVEGFCHELRSCLRVAQVFIDLADATPHAKARLGADGALPDLDALGFMAAIHHDIPNARL